MKNWKSIVEKNQAKTFVLPAGWDSRAKIAEQLVCSDDQVGRLLNPMVKAGTIEVKVFPVWDPATKRVMRVTAYREKAVVLGTPQKTSKPRPEHRIR